MICKVSVLFFGDIVGRIGRNAVSSFLSSCDKKYDFIIANVENASHGFGLTNKNYNQLSDLGINCFTSGNHIWDKKEIFNYIDSAEKLIRPMNYPEGTLGEGYRIFDLGEYKIAVLNLLGRVFMQPIDSPWQIINDKIDEIKKITPNIIIDFHAEASAEKICFGKFCSDFGISAVLGTHTHVQTVDNEITNNMAYITDVGFCGAKDSVIGMEFRTSLVRMKTGLPERFEVAQNSAAQINAVEITLNPLSGEAIDIKRIYESINFEDSNEKEYFNEEKSGLGG